MVRLFPRCGTAAQQCASQHRCTIDLAGALAIVIFSCGPSATQAAKFLSLSDLAGGAFTSSAFGVSANGSVVVGRGNSASGIEAFRWTSGTGMAGLGDLAGGAFSSSAFGISADGSVVVGNSNSASGFETFRWTSGGGMIGLGDLAGGVFDSNAYGVSADGSVVVGWGNSASGEEASRWTSGGGMVGLGDLTGGAFGSVAQAASADGSVVVGWGNSTLGNEAFRWTSGGGMVGLGDLAGGGFGSFAMGVSADGSVVVGWGNSASGREASRWTSGGGMVGLGDLAGGVFDSIANGISADGSVVVGQGTSASGSEAFVWDAANGIRNLKTVLLSSVGAALNGWSLIQANAISADGRTIVGSGTNPGGNPEGWLAYLPDQIFWFPETSGSWDSSLSWSGPFLPSAADPVVITPASGVTVTGSAVNRTVKSLTIGTTGSGQAVLDLNGGGDLTALQSITINARGRIDVGTGRVLAAPAVSNSGVLSGDGQVAADVINLAGGEVRVASGQRLDLGGSAGHFNQGKIEAIGGEIEFGVGVTNFASTGLITGQNATLRFDGGLTNNGSLAVTYGVNNISGDIANNAGGKIIVAAGAHATFYDDVTQNGTLQVIKVGATNSVAVFAGVFTGSGGSSGGGDIFFLGDLRPGNSPAIVTFDNNVVIDSSSTTHIEIGGPNAGTQYDRIVVSRELSLYGALDVSLNDGFSPSAGRSFDILDWGSLSGTFSSIQLPALASGLEWSTSQLYTTGTLSVGIPGDFNNNGIVDAPDYVVWRKGLGTTYTQSDYNIWRSHFGQTAGSGSALPSSESLSAAAPEPASALLLILGTVAGTWRGRRFALRVS